jgi:hypothetical protein
MWWAAAGSGLRCALVALLDDMPPDTPLLLLATAELPASDPGTAAAGPGKSSSNSRRLLTGPLQITSAAAAAAAGCSNAGREDHLQQQQQPDLEALGLEPSLAALFPPLGQLSDIQALLSDLQQHRRRSRSPVQEAARLLARRPEQQLQSSGQQQKQAEDTAAGAGCDVLGWVLLEAPGPSQRRNMFQVCVWDTRAYSTAFASAVMQQMCMHSHHCLCMLCPVSPPEQRTLC